MKRSVKEKMELVRRILSGEPFKCITKETGLGQAYLSLLYDRYKKYGKKGLERKTNHYLSPEQKEFIIRLHEENGVSLRQIYTNYDISPSVFKRLLIQVRSYGYECLYERRVRGCPPKDPMARPKKKDPQTELEKLQVENLRLRAENALLKK